MHNLELKNPKKTVVSEFSSLTKFMKHLDTNMDTWTRNTKSFTNGYDFTETNNLQEAVNMLATGNQEIKDGLKNAVKHAIADLDKELNSDVEGYIADTTGLFFDVARVLTGEPECWYREPYDKTKNPRVTVPIMGNYRGTFDARDAIKNASKTIALIKAMEDKGIEVAVEMCFLSQWAEDAKPYRDSFVSVAVKNFDETFNWNKLSAMLHPSFFRRLIFRERELQFPDGLDAYGSTPKNFADVIVGGENLLQLQDAHSIEKFKTEVLTALKGA